MSTPEDEIEIKYKECKKLVLILQSQLTDLETGADTSVFLQGRIATNINALSRLTNALQNLQSQLPSSRELWRIKVRQIVEEQKTIREAMERYFSEHHLNQLRQDERHRFLSERRADGRLTSDGSHSKDVSYFYHEGQSLQHSHRILDELLEMGGAIKSTLLQQRVTLKAIRRKVLDIALTLGVSHSVIRLVERRNFIDKIIVYTGMILTLLFIAFLVYYFRT
jgi:Golgi SNAP receptor complex protein 2